MGNVPAAGFNTWTPGHWRRRQFYTVSLTGAPVPTDGLLDQHGLHRLERRQPGPYHSNWATDVSGGTDTMQLPGRTTNVYLAASVRVLAGNHAGYRISASTA